jgi:hypothetical protein
VTQPALLDQAKQLLEKVDQDTLRVLNPLLARLT